MGIPRYFRYMCERYPCIMEVVDEYQIPEYDNLYVDLNGIVNSSIFLNYNPNPVIFKEELLRNTFHFIDLLFGMIKPKKLLFLSTDGVVPMVKTDSVRQRMFKISKEAAIPLQDELPARLAICIKSGTDFAEYFNKQLQYFVAKKISTNKLWQKCKIIVSGPEVPGEAEIKMFDYIRYMRSQPDYNPHTRHCFYTIDPHMIRITSSTNEVNVSILKQAQLNKALYSSPNVVEQMKFNLIHLSLLKEYLELEFHLVKNNLPFLFDMDKIVDDWVLMELLFGNAYIPPLPNINMANDAFTVMYSAYIKVLPTLGGYINEAGTLNLKRFECFLSELGNLDLEIFSKQLKVNNVSKQEEDVNNGTRGTSANLIHAQFLQHKTDYYKDKFGYTTFTKEILKSQVEEYVCTIQWILHYYYDGICSWSWRYPYHYAPYASDIQNISNLTFNFELGEPQNPHEQVK